MPVGGEVVGPGISSPPGAGAISSITSNGGTISVLDGTGPSVNLEVAPVPFTTAAGNLPTDHDLTTGLATWLTTSSLAIGHWLVSVSGMVDTGSATNVVEMTTVVGTALATFTGPFSSELDGALGFLPFSYTFLANVTQAGTLLLQAIASATTGTPFVAAETSANAFAQASGYTAVLLRA